MPTLTADDFAILASALAPQMTGGDVMQAVVSSVPHLRAEERGLRIEELYERGLLDAYASKAANGKYAVCAPKKVTLAGRAAIDSYKAPGWVGG